MNEKQQRELAAGLKALADGTRAAGASRRVEEAVMAEMIRVSAAREFPSRAAALAIAPSWRLLAIAAVLVLAVGSAVWIARPAPTPVPTPTGALSGFVPLPLAHALPEIESASIVRVSVPVAALPGYGVAIVPEMTSELVEADFLVAQDGHPRAIRLVQNSATTGSTP